MDTSKEFYIYIICRIDNGKAVAPCKVGITSSIGGRLTTLQTAAPFKIDLFHAFRLPQRDMAQAVELSFHTVRKADRLHGEWFDMDPKLAGALMVLNLTAFVEVHLEFQGEERDYVLNSVFNGYDLTFLQ